MAFALQAGCRQQVLLRKPGTTRRLAVAVNAVAPSPESTEKRRRAIVTGANSGIGWEASKALRQQGYDIVMACRDMQKAEAAKQRLQQAVPGGGSVELLLLDLADLTSVRTAGAQLLDDGQPIAVLLNNAGVMATPQLQTKEGFEYQLGVNHLGHFLLTNLLLPLLTTPDTPSRVVNVSSAAHYFGHVHFEDLMLRNSYDPWRAYGQSKLANVLFTYELARRLPISANCTAAALHPGVVNTELGRFITPESPAWWQAPLLAAAKRLTLTPEEGARTSVYCATSPAVEGVTGKYYDKCRPVASSAESYDTSVQQRFWDVSAELVRLDPPAPAAGQADGGPAVVSYELSV